MKLLFTLLITVVNLLAVGQSTSTISSKIDQYLKRYHNNGKFNGNILIGKGDSLVYSNSFGFANNQQQVPNSDSTKFLIGSITKPFTAMAILILEEQGKLTLADKLAKYFPSFQAANKITIAQLLTHTAGLADYRVLPDWKADSKSDSTTPYSTVDKMSDQALLFQPGEKFKYSNLGYILLGLIIEKVSQQSFADFLEEHLLNPLQLNDTGVIDNRTVVPNLANGYSTNPRETSVAEYINYLQPFTSGNMYSTTADLWKFTRAVLNNELFSPEKTEQIFSSGKTYGFGWGIRNFDGVDAYGHYGAMNGFVGAMTYLTKNDYFICFLTNDDNTPMVAITNDLISILEGKTIHIPLKTDLIHLSDTIKKQVIGDYLVKQGDTLTVFEANNRLYLQETGQVKHELFPYDAYQFSFQLFAFNCVFDNVEKGQAQILKFEGNRTILTAKRISESDKK